MPTKRKKTNWQHPLYRHGFVRDLDGFCQIDIHYEGKRYRKNIGLTFIRENKDLALRILEKEIRRIVYKETDAKLATIKEVWDEFMNLKVKQLAKSSLNKYNQAFKEYLNPNLFISNANEINSDLIDKIKNSKLSNNSQNKQLALIKGFFNYCLEQQYIERNPLTKSLIPKEKVNNPNPYSDKDVSKLLLYFQESNLDMYNLIDLLNNSGLRISEALLSTKNDYRDNVFFIPAVNSKTNKERYIPLETFPELRNIIERILLSNTDKLIKWDNYDYPYELLKKACTELKIKNKGFHGFRKAFENRLINDGYPVNHTAQILGHSIAIQQKHYIQVLGAKDLQEALIKSRKKE